MSEEKKIKGTFLGNKSNEKIATHTQKKPLTQDEKDPNELITRSYYVARKDDELLKHLIEDLDGFNETRRNLNKSTIVRIAIRYLESQKNEGGNKFDKKIKEILQRCI